MTKSFWEKSSRSLTDNDESHVVIIGGGFIGLSTAYWISELNPQKKVIVLERSYCGSGASGKNAGFLTKGSALFYHKLIEQWGEDDAHSIHTYASQSLALLDQHILSSCKMQCERTTSVTFLRDKISLPQKFAFQNSDSVPRPSGVSYSLVGQNEFKINPRELLSTLKAMLLQRGVQIIEETSGHQITAEGVRTSGNTLLTESVVLAVNGYAEVFHPSFGPLVRPARAQMLALKIKADTRWSSSLYYDPAQRVYFRSESPDVLLLGGKRLLDERGESSGIERLSPLIQQALEDYAARELGLKFNVLHRWSGIMGLTPHELPYIDLIRAPMKTILAAGFSGHGMGFGFYAGKESAELALGLKEKSFFSRFGSPNLDIE